MVLSVTIRINKCCAPSGHVPRFEATLNDVVLIRGKNKTLHYATIRSLNTLGTVVVAYMAGVDEIEEEISVADIEALMLDE